MILASTEEMTVDRLADMANRIIDAGTPAISSVSKLLEGGDVQTNIIREEIAAALQ